MQKVAGVILKFLIFINFLYVFSGAVNYPLAGIDVYSIWLLKAKEFFINGVLPLSQLNQYSYSHPHYPILVPFMFSFIYYLAGGINELYVLIIYPFIYLSILFLAYKVLRHLKFGSLASLVTVYVYSMMGPLLAAGGRMHAGEADIFLALINWMIVYILQKYFANKKLKYLFWIAILIGVSSQIKLEGIIPAVLFLFVPVNKITKLKLIAVAILPAFVWEIVRRSSGVVADFGVTMIGPAELVKNSWLVVSLVTKEMLNFRNWYFIWPLIILVLIFFKPPKSEIYEVIKKSLLVMICVYFMNYLFNTHETANYIISTADRIMLQLSSFSVVIIAMKLKQSVIK
jgi:hypothetical protein